MHYPEQYKEEALANKAYRAETRRIKATGQAIIDDAVALLKDQMYDNWTQIHVAVLWGANCYFRWPNKDRSIDNGMMDGAARNLVSWEGDRFFDKLEKYFKAPYVDRVQQWKRSEGLDRDYNGYFEGDIDFDSDFPF